MPKPFSVKRISTKKSKRALDALATDAKKQVAGFLYQEGEIIMGMSKQLVPVDEGVLRASGTAHLPREEGGSIVVDLTYGGAAEAYAIVQHDDLTLNHPNGGQAKYLETPYLERARGMARRMKRVLSAAAKKYGVS